MHRRPRLLALTLALALPGCRESPPPPPPEPMAPMETSGPLKGQHGEALYKAERYHEAAWIFEQILRRGLPEDRPRVEFWLAKSYFKLYDYPRALAGFAAISEQPEHPYHTLAFPWLLSLYLHAMPPEPRLIAALLSYPEAEVRAEEAYDEVIADYDLLLAEQALRRGDARGALRYLEAAEREAGDYRSARMLLSAGRVRERLGQRDAARELFERCAARLSEQPPRRLRRYYRGNALDQWMWIEANRGLARTGGKPDERAMQ
ncbi:MAG: hypothetical protein H6713_30325 [Myxococcales bacterium]|nr:hypothetical protein [Myxococcales bacterium]MCB9754262.1 hypothetical protein [Myxococcales bacterium]